jgi:hypothetical protein
VGSSPITSANSSLWNPALEITHAWQSEANGQARVSCKRGAQARGQDQEDRKARGQGQEDRDGHEDQVPAEGRHKGEGPCESGQADDRIDQRIRDLGGWRGETLARMRALILEADPGMTEECKWVKPTNPLGVPVWSHDGIVCTGEAYTKAVKLTFARGASIPDPSHLFNASLGGNTRRAIDIHEGEKVDARAFKALVKAAVAQNDVSAKKR